MFTGNSFFSESYWRVQPKFEARCVAMAQRQEFAAARRAPSVLVFEGDGVAMREEWHLAMAAQREAVRQRAEAAPRDVLPHNLMARVCASRASAAALCVRLAVSGEGQGEAHGTRVPSRYGSLLKI